MDGQQTQTQDGQKVIEDIIQSIKESGVPIESFVRLGNMAEKTIKNPDMYPMVVDAAIKMNIAEPGDLGATINYRNLALLSTIGKVAQQMMGGVA